MPDLKRKLTIHALRNNAMPDETMRDVKMALRGYHEGSGDARLLEREQIARMVESMYGPHDRRFKIAMEIVNAIRAGSKP